MSLKQIGSVLIYLFEKVHTHKQGEGEGERESSVGSIPSAEFNVELDPTTLKSLPEQKSQITCSTY